MVNCSYDLPRCEAKWDPNHRKLSEIARQEAVSCRVPSRCLLVHEHGMPKIMSPCHVCWPDEAGATTFSNWRTKGSIPRIWRVPCSLWTKQQPCHYTLHNSQLATCCSKWYRRRNLCRRYFCDFIQTVRPRTPANYEIHPIVPLSF